MKKLLSVANAAKTPLAILLILTGVAYLCVRFGGFPKRIMVLVPVTFVIYLGVDSLIPKSKKRKRTKQ